MTLAATYKFEPILAKYNKEGTLLAVGLADGSSSLHNALRQHTQIHNLQIDYTGGKFCIDFDRRGNFGMIGDKGSNVLVFGANF